MIRTKSWVWIPALAALGRDDGGVAYSRNRTVAPGLPAMSITAKPIQDSLAAELGPHAVKILELVRNVK